MTQKSILQQLIELQNLTKEAIEESRDFREIKRLYVVYSCYERCIENVEQILHEVDQLEMGK
jgi:hypothetical protein